MRLFSLLLVTPMLAAAGCGSASKDKDSPQPSPQPTPVTVDKAQTPDVLSTITSKPTPPLKLAAPRSPEKMLNGDDLSEMETDTLVEMGDELAQNREYAAAAQALHWACLKGHHSQYDLACYLARAGKADAAFYFLQKAALGEGVDAEWAKEDKDLTSLRSDPRWRELFPFLRSACAYWHSSGLVRTSVVLPKGYDKNKPIPVVVGLHGLNSNPEHFIGQEYQKITDDLQVALVAVSGTYPRGEWAFAWAEDVKKDSSHVSAALESLKDKLTIERGAIALYGFSQGAQMAFEVAAADPNRFLGALVLSPGSLSTRNFSGLKRSGSARQIFFARCGGGEHPNTIAATRAIQTWAKASGAKCDLKIYPDMDTHSFPPDFLDLFPIWIRTVLGLRADK